MARMCNNKISLIQNGSDVMGKPDASRKVWPRLLSSDHRIFVITDFTDCRKGIKGLQEILEIDYEQNIYGENTGDSYLFCGRLHDRIKILRFENNETILGQIRLEEGRFRWPRANAELWEIPPQALERLLSGEEITQPMTLSIRKSILYDEPE